jgi:hypothetical protein
MVELMQDDQEILDKIPVHFLLSRSAEAEAEVIQMVLELLVVLAVVLVVLMVLSQQEDPVIKHLLVNWEELLVQHMEILVVVPPL